MQDWYTLPGFNQPMSSMSHLIGAIVFFVLAFFMLSASWTNRARFWFCGVFAFAAVVLLSLSGVFHMFHPDYLPRRVMIRLDVAAIFLLIAASFTPMHAILFHGWKRWGVLIPIWIFAITMITLRTIFFDSLPYAWGTVIFLLMGWVGLYSTITVYRSYGRRIAMPIVYGGMCYTTGAVLDSFQWPTIVPMVWGSHETFHLLVLAGLSFHWYLFYQIANGTLTIADRIDQLATNQNVSEEDHTSPELAESQSKVA